MAKGIGRLLRFAIARETTRGTIPASPDFWLATGEIGIDEKFEDEQDPQTFALVEDSVGEHRTKNWAEGPVTGPIGDQSFPLILYATLGALATGDNPDSDATVKDHTITVAQSYQHQSLSLYIDDPLGAQDYKHANGMVSKLDISYRLGSFVMFTAAFRARSGADATLTPSNPTENRFLAQHVTFKIASSLSGLDAASAVKVKSLSISMEPNIEDDDVLKQSGPVDFLNKQLVITGTIEAIWQGDADFKDAALAGTAKAMRIDMKNTDVIIGASANPEIKIDLASVVFTAITRPIQVREIVKQSLSFKAHYSASDSLMIRIIATNTKASY